MLCHFAEETLGRTNRRYVIWPEATHCAERSPTGSYEATCLPPLPLFLERDIIVSGKKIQFALARENDRLFSLSLSFFPSLRSGKSRFAKSKLEMASSGSRCCRWPLIFPRYVRRQIADQSRFPRNREFSDRSDRIEFRWDRNCSSFPARRVSPRMRLLP